MNIPDMIIVFVLAYLLGSIPAAVWIGKMFHNIDVRQHGSGNAGAANVIRVLGWKTGIPVMIIDLAKGWTAAMLPQFFHIAASRQCPAYKSADPYRSYSYNRTYFSCFCRFQGRKRSCHRFWSTACHTTIADYMLPRSFSGSAADYRYCFGLINECRNSFPCIAFPLLRHPFSNI